MGWDSGPARSGRKSQGFVWLSGIVPATTPPTRLSRELRIPGREHDAISLRVHGDGKVIAAGRERRTKNVGGAHRGLERSRCAAAQNDLVLLRAAGHRLRPVGGTGSRGGISTRAIAVRVQDERTAVREADDGTAGVVERCRHMRRYNGRRTSDADR